MAPNHPNRSLFEILQAVSGRDAGINFYNKSKTWESEIIRISYKQLITDAKEKADVLLRIPSQTRSRVLLIHLDRQIESITWFWAVVYAGFLPAISTPLSSNAQQREQHIHHLLTLLDNPIILTSEGLVRRFPELKQPSTQVIESLPCSVDHVDDFVTNDIPSGRVASPWQDSPIKEEEPAVLMLTSGSTGNVKAVSLTVPQILASIRGKGKACNTTEKFVFLNWIGLDHVANLLEIHIHAMYYGAEQVQVQSNDIISDPFLLLNLIHKHRVSHTFAPNFFLELLSKELSLAEPADPVFSLDLSCLRNIVTGGEANVVSTAKIVTEQLHSLGARGQLLCVAYGLTEACAGLTYGMFDPGYEDQEGHEFASVGRPIDGVKIRVQTTEEISTEPYKVGELHLFGDLVFKNYYHDHVSTTTAFTKDGWFISGDRGYIDSAGKLNITGRTKEILIINGVNYSPQHIENALEMARIPGVIPSYFVTFSHRPKGSETEGYCVIYSPQNCFEDSRTRDRIAECVAQAASSVPGVRPDWIIPLPVACLERSSLGKLSRGKLKREFDAGAFNGVMIRCTLPIRPRLQAAHVVPATKTEQKIVDVLSQMLEIPKDIISVNQTIFELGITSISLFCFAKLLQTQLKTGNETTIISSLNNPAIRSIANVIDDGNSRQYNPVAQLQARGDKLPLWLVHPATGNVLSFLPLARTMVDRPLYALTSRGLGSNETVFSSIGEMSNTYYQHVKRVQPNGPYVIAGYSLGSTVAYELAKRLEVNGNEVAFCGMIGSPPHIRSFMKHLDWTAVAVRVAYFLELIAQDDIPGYEKQLRGLPQLEVVRRLLAMSRPGQLPKLELSPEQLMAIIYVTNAFGKLAREYEPSGKIKKVDIFYSTPLHSVCLNKEEWVNDQLMKWQDFSREPIELIGCEGGHADMLNGSYVEGFDHRLNKALAARGL